MKKNMVNPLEINKMEEKKEARIVNLNPTQAPEDKPQKMSYEQLENIAHQLSEQAKTLYARLQETNMANMFKRLDYLFKIVENAHAFNEAFVNKCVAEIEGLMTIPENEEETDGRVENKN